MENQEKIGMPIEMVPVLKVINFMDRKGKKKKKFEKKKSIE